MGLLYYPCRIWYQLMGKSHIKSNVILLHCKSIPHLKQVLSWTFIIVWDSQKSFPERKNEPIGSSLMVEVAAKKSLWINLHGTAEKHWERYKHETQLESEENNSCAYETGLL